MIDPDKASALQPSSLSDVTDNHQHSRSRATDGSLSLRELKNIREDLRANRETLNGKVSYELGLGAD